MSYDKEAVQEIIDEVFPTLTVYDNETHLSGPVKVGDIVRLVRGNGMREGQVMGRARILRADSALEFEVV